MSSQNTDSYEKPTLVVVGSLHELTLAHNKYATLTPDGILYHPASGPPISLSS
jgi:hypothetical protein